MKAFSTTIQQRSIFLHFTNSLQSINYEKGLEIYNDIT